MRGIKFKSAKFSNKKKEIHIIYTSEKLVKIHYRDLGINKKIENIKVDKETGQKSLIIKFTDGKYDFLPYDQPLHIIGDPEYLLQNHIENIIAQIRTKISQKKVSVTYLAKQLNISDHQMQNLLNPNRLNKNLKQLYKLAHLLNLEFEMHLKAA